MRPPVGIGVPRSGTGFLAQIMGWRHEAYYRPGCQGSDHPEPEVSWLAVPFLNPDETPILHIVRHPLKVVASNIKQDWLNSNNSWGWFAHTHTNTYDIWDFYLEWLQRCDTIAHGTVRLEDFQHLAPAYNARGPVEKLSARDVPQRHKAKIALICEQFSYDL